MSFAALLLAATSPSVASVETTEHQRLPVIESSAQATVRVLRAERVDASREYAPKDTCTRVYRDEAGTLWVEFS